MMLLLSIAILTAGLPVAACYRLDPEGSSGLGELRYQTALRLEIACYALPYGGLGFASHMLTYYTIAALACGRQPLRPWKPLELKWWDRPLAVVQLVGTVALSVLTMVRCRQRWEFVLVAVWMMTTAMTLATVSFFGPVGLRHYQGTNKSFQFSWNQPVTITRKTPTGQQEPGSAELARNSDNTRPNDMMRGRRYYLYALGSFWMAGSVVGFLGTLTITIPVFGAGSCFQATVGVFFIPGASVVAFTIAIFIIYFWPGLRKLVKSPKEAISEMRDAFFWWIVGLFCITAVGASFFGLFWMDWCIGSVARNIAGVPSRANSAIFWTWFALKRLGLFAA